VEILNPGLVTFPMSCRTGEGVGQWVGWLVQQVAAHQGQVRTNAT
jgi:hydrogenase nickel incorporation protein HypB